MFVFEIEACHCHNDNVLKQNLGTCAAGGSQVMHHLAFIAVLVKSKKLSHCHVAYLQQSSAA